MSREWIIDDDFLDEETKSSADGQGYLTELVRCKDCKHYGKFGMKCNKLHLTPIESWRYCSYGERADT